MKYLYVGKKHRLDDGSFLPEGSVVDFPDGLPASFADKFKPVDESTEVTEQDENRLRTDGPSLEEYVSRGYLAANYPPSGYAEVPSPGLDAFRADGTVPNTRPKQPLVEPPAEPPEPAESKTAPIDELDV